MKQLLFYLTLLVVFQILFNFPSSCDAAIVIYVNEGYTETGRNLSFVSRESTFGPRLSLDGVKFFHFLNYNSLTFSFILARRKIGESFSK